MLNISFERNSLLYGESCFLFAYAIFIPFFFWPDTLKTRTKHVLIMTKGRRRLLRFLMGIWDVLALRYLAWTLVLSTQIPYAIILVAVGSLVQKDFLVVLRGVDEEGLAYKTLYYAPILCRIGTFLLIMIALWNRGNYREWPTLDSYEIFSVNRATQLRVMLFGVLIIIPDLICSWTEMMLLLTFLRSDRYKWFQFSRANKLMNALFIVIVSGVNTTSLIIRYKPFISILYTAFCVRNHMRLLKSQLYLSFSRTDTATARMLMSRFGGHAKPRAKDKQKAPFEVKFGASQMPKEMLSRPVALQRASDAQQWQQHLETRRVSGREHMHLYIDNKIAASRRQSALMEVSQRELIDGGAEPPGWNEEPLHEIRSLFELEKHLTQIYLFVASMDRCSPGSIFVLAFFNMIAFFYAYLFNRSLSAEHMNLVLSFLFLFSRLIPVCSLFIAGHLMERECRKISNLLEIIYLENSSHSLLYRQLKDSQYSLGRIFRLLNWIKFDGDGLMAINLDSLKRLLFFMVSGIFIIIQYDSLLVFDESPSGQPATATTEAQLAREAINSSWIRISLSGS